MAKYVGTIIFFKGKCKEKNKKIKKRILTVDGLLALKYDQTSWSDPFDDDNLILKSKTFQDILNDAQKSLKSGDKLTESVFFVEPFLK